MTGTAGFSFQDARRRSNEARTLFIRQFTAGLPVTTLLALTGLSAYAAFANFGIGWALAAGASNWEAAVWPIAVTAVTTQALFCYVRFVPDMHVSWARWLFAGVAAAGMALAALGNGLRLDGSLPELGPVASSSVLAVPVLCLMLSAWMTGLFLFAIDPVISRPTFPMRAARDEEPNDQPGVAAEGPSPWWTEHEKQAKPNDDHTAHGSSPLGQ